MSRCVCWTSNNVRCPNQAVDGKTRCRWCLEQEAERQRRKKGK